MSLTRRQALVASLAVGLFGLPVSSKLEVFKALYPPVKFEWHPDSEWVNDITQGQGFTPKGKYNYTQIWKRGT